MHRTIPTLIVAVTASLREELGNKLGLPDFRVVAYKASLSAIRPEEFPRDECCLLVIEAAETPSLVSAQIAQLKRRNALCRIVVMGQNWTPADIATAFEAGVNAHFSDTAVSTEFLKAVKLVTR